VGDARAALEQTPVTDDPRWHECWFWQRIYEGEYQGALDDLSGLSTTCIKQQLSYVPRSLLEGFAYELLGQSELAHASFDSARVLLEHEVKRNPNDYRLHRSLGLCWAGLGVKEQAIAEAKRGVALLPIESDAVLAPLGLEDLALVYVMVGEDDAAMAEIERLLDMPSWLSTAKLRVDPRWRSLFENPRFLRLLQDHKS
jgi:tetratricopeptide (TPR) repeat protein